MPRALSLIALALLAAGCGTDEGEKGPYLLARVDGELFREGASEGTVVYTADAPDGPGTVYSIASRSAIGSVEYLAIDLPYPPAVGAFPLGGDTAFAAFATCPTAEFTDCSYWSAIGSDPGTLEITAIDTSTGMISGAFAFHGHFGGDSAGAVRTIADGHFLIHFAGGPPAVRSPEH